MNIVGILASIALFLYTHSLLNKRHSIKQDKTPIVGRYGIWFPPSDNSNNPFDKQDKQ